MGHNSVVSSHLKSTGILRVDGFSTGPPNLRCHMHEMFITRKKLSSLDGERRINNVVCILLLILISYVLHFI